MDKELYTVIAACAAVLALVLAGASWVRTRLPNTITEKEGTEEGGHGEEEHRVRQLRRLQRRFLTGQGLAVLGDWLQGPYFYLVYEQAGLGRIEVQRLFVVGFGSAALFGIVAGTSADKYGRKRLAVVYFVLYAISCASVHVQGCVWALAAGRVLGGICTALLFSTFDAWVVAEHVRAGLPPEWLPDTFALAGLNNFAMAIVASFAAQAVSSLPERRVGLGGGVSVSYGGGNVAPFELAGVVCLVGAATVSSFWDENKGQSNNGTRSVGTTTLMQPPDRKPGQEAHDPEADAGALEESLLAVGVDGSPPSSEHGLGHTMEAGLAAIRTVTRSPPLLLLGGVTCCFEAAMYVFVIAWTPALGDPPPPPGYVFASFMAGSMFGSQLFKASEKLVGLNTGLSLMLICATTSLTVPVLLFPAAQGSTGARRWFGCFFLFEVCVGHYWPAISSLKAQIVPELERATVYGVLRTPLNFVVVALLLAKLSVRQTLGAGSILLGIAALCSALLQCQRIAGRTEGAPQHN